MQSPCPVPCNIPSCKDTGCYHKLGNCGHPAGQVLCTRRVARAGFRFPFWPDECLFRTLLRGVRPWHRITLGSTNAKLLLWIDVVLSGSKRSTTGLLWAIFWKLWIFFFFFFKSHFVLFKFTCAVCFEIHFTMNSLCWLYSCVKFILSKMPNELRSPWAYFSFSPRRIMGPPS